MIFLLIMWDIPAIAMLDGTTLTFSWWKQCATAKNRSPTVYTHPNCSIDPKHADFGKGHALNIWVKFWVSMLYFTGNSHPSSRKASLRFYITRFFRFDVEDSNGAAVFPGGALVRGQLEGPDEITLVEWSKWTINLPPKKEVSWVLSIYYIYIL